MTNQALPKKSRELLNRHSDQCQNLGLMLDKFAPWNQNRDHNWDLSIVDTVRSQGQDQLKTKTGGEAKGVWLSNKRVAKTGEGKSLFEASRVDQDLMRDHQARWKYRVSESGGIMFALTLQERLVAGLGATHVLETSLALERNTGLPYLPASSVKGLARAWGLIEVAAQLDIKIQPDLTSEDQPLNQLADVLITEPKTTLYQAVNRIIHGDSNEDAKSYLDWFRVVFGWAGSKSDSGQAGMICFTDAIYWGEQPPLFANDVMTPHYVQYFTDRGVHAYPSEDNNPNPVSFLTVDRKNSFAFGLIPRANTAIIYGDQTTQLGLEIAQGWLVKGLSQLGAGSKTSSGYGFFNDKPLMIEL